MYYYIKGKIVYKDETSIALDSNGVAYKISTTLTTLSNIGNLGDEATVYTYLHIREDVMELYGFSTKEEKDIFLLLISVTGVGPKAALAILSVLSADKFALAVVTNDEKSITKAAGVGAKLAQRIILELKDKLKNEDLVSLPDAHEDVADTNNYNEAISALVSLGYTVNDAKSALKGVDKNMSVEEIIKKALMNF